MTPGPVPEPWSCRGQRSPLRILHLSDLHEGQPGREALWRRRRVLGEAWLKNLEVIAGAGGRLIWCASPGMWPSRGGERSMLALPISCASWLGFGPERFFAVPGNHDMGGGLAGTA